MVEETVRSNDRYVFMSRLAMMNRLLGQLASIAKDIAMRNRSSTRSACVLTERDADAGGQLWWIVPKTSAEYFCDRLQRSRQATDTDNLSAVSASKSTKISPSIDILTLCSWFV